MVNEKIFQTEQPSPYLKEEEIQIKEKNNSPEPKKQEEKADSRYYFRSKSFLNASRYPPLSPTKAQRKEEED